MSKFSFSRLLNAMANPHDSEALRAADTELQRVGRGDKTGGFTIPTDAVRDLTTASGSGDGAVETTQRGDLFIDSLLGMNYVLNRAKVYSGLNGNTDIPAEDTTGTASWVGENGAPTETDPVYRQVTLSPKRLTTYVDVSRIVLIQGNPDIEDLIRHLLLRQIARSLDNACLFGTGTNNQPTGVANLTGKNADISLTAANAARGDKLWEACCNAESNLASANVDEMRVEALMSPAWYYGCRFRSYDGNNNRSTVDSGLAILPEKDSPLLEQYPVTKSGIASTGSGMFLGNWNHVVIGQWTDGFELMVNPYELDTQGLVRVCIESLADVQVEHVKAFQRILVS